MNLISLPGSDRRTPQLGFGCAYITPENEEALDAAFDAGIRHFDVARSYGRGLTEGILGRFIRRHPGAITITSKFGIVPPFSRPIHALARQLLKPLISRLRRSRSFDRRMNASQVLSVVKASFTGAEAIASLEISLRNLQTDRIDLFMMHEAEPADLGDPTLLDALIEATRRGTIGAFGVGGRATHLPELLAQRPDFCRVLQYDWNALQTIPADSATLPIVYRVHGEPSRQARAAFAADADRLRLWSDEIDQDLTVPGVLEQLLLAATVRLRPDALVLFSSSRPAHIAANVRAVTDSSKSQAGLRLVELLRTSQSLRAEVV